MVIRTCPGGGVYFERVVEQDQQELFEVVGVAVDDDVSERVGGGGLQGDAVGHPGGLAAGGGKDLVEVDRAGFEGGAGVGAGEDEQLPDHAGHAVGVRGDVGQALGEELRIVPASEQVDRAADARQGCP